MPADIRCSGRVRAPCGLRPEGPPSAGGYLPIGEHGMVGDLHTVALVGAEGTIDWYCPARIDAPSVFGALVDARRGGHWSLCPAGRHWRSRQHYLPDTNVLVTRFRSDEGELEVQDFMPVGPTPGTLVRRVVGVRGEPHLVMEIEPRFDYARRPHAVQVRDGGGLFESDGKLLALHAPLRLRRTRAGVQAKFCVAPAEVLTLLLSPADPPALADGAFDDSIAFWRGWLAGSRYEGRWREAVHRSALALKLLTHEPSGALAAAATTSLPARLGGGRRRDGRHPSREDAARAAELLRRLGLEGESRASLSRPAGRAETELDGFEGWRGCGPVRIGAPLEPASSSRGLPRAAFRAAEELARAERLEPARRSFEMALAYANRLGLLSETVGPGGEQLGNFPHAATHLALVSAALALDGPLGPDEPSGKT
jgi:GH15 family glucan-1,4-alpha-glucosidase